MRAFAKCSVPTALLYLSYLSSPYIKLPVDFRIDYYADFFERESSRGTSGSRLSFLIMLLASTFLLSVFVPAVSVLI
jgi:hypothetical protein